MDGAALIDDNLGTSATIAAGQHGVRLVQYEFAQPIQARRSP